MQGRERLGRRIVELKTIEPSPERLVDRVMSRPGASRGPDRLPDGRAGGLRS